MSLYLKSHDNRCRYIWNHMITGCFASLTGQYGFIFYPYVHPPLARSYSAPGPSVYNPWRMNIQGTSLFSCFVLYKPVSDFILCTESIQYNQIVRDRRILFILDVFTVWSVFTDAMWWVFSIYIHLQCFSLNILMLNTVCCSF